MYNQNVVEFRNAYKYIAKCYSILFSLFMTIGVFVLHPLNNYISKN